MNMLFGAASGAHPGSREAVLQAERVAVISQILSKHTGPVRHLRLATKTRFQGDGNGQGIATNAVNGKGVEELIVNSTYPIQFFSSLPFHSIQVNNCDWFPLQPPLPAVFKNIKELSLQGVNFSAIGVYVLLEQCVALESLLLSSFHKDQKDKIIRTEPAYCRGTLLLVRSQSLRCLFLDVLGLKRVIIMDAPNLERLLGEVSIQNSHCKVVLVNAPKLQIVGFLTMELPEPQLMTGMSLEPSRSIHSIKILGLCLDLCEISQVERMLQMLKYFPCVETLHIKIFANASIRRTLNYEFPYSSLLQLAGRAGCLRDTVKTIVVGDLWLHAYTFGLLFAKILLESAKKLELMKIFHVPVDKRKHSRSYRHKLGLKCNPSIKAQVIFPGAYISYRQVSDVLMDASNFAIPDTMFYQRTFRSSYIRKEWNCYLEPMEIYF